MPQFVRLFTPGGPDDVRFANLAPLPVGSAWSAVALISPNRPNQTAGLLAQQAAGARAFCVGLHDGCIVVEAATESRATRLAPPLNQWSIVGVSSAADGARVYLGTGANVSVEDIPGLAAARSSSDAAILVGHIGETFSGAIGLVCLFIDKLADATMRSIAGGRLDPLFAPKLCFAWLSAAPDQIDMVSRRVPTITGTRIIPFNGAGGNVLYAPVAPNVPRVQNAPAQPQPQAAPIPKPTIAPPPPKAAEAMSRVQPPQQPTIARPSAPDAAPIPKAPPAMPKALPMVERTPVPQATVEAQEIIDPAAAAKSALFRELGLVNSDPPGEKES